MTQNIGLASRCPGQEGTPGSAYKAALLRWREVGGSKVDGRTPPSLSRIFWGAIPPIRSPGEVLWTIGPPAERLVGLLGVPGAGQCWTSQHFCFTVLLSHLPYPPPSPPHEGLAPTSPPRLCFVGDTGWLKCPSCRTWRSALESSRDMSIKLSSSVETCTLLWASKCPNLLSSLGWKKDDWRWDRNLRACQSPGKQVDFSSEEQRGEPPV